MEKTVAQGARLRVCDLATVLEVEMPHGISMVSGVPERGLLRSLRLLAKRARLDASRASRARNWLRRAQKTDCPLQVMVI